MTVYDSRPTLLVDRPPIYRLLWLFAAFCFVGLLATDLAYWRTAVMLWSDFSSWLVTVGVVAGWLALVVGLIECIASRAVRARTRLWPYAVGNLVALILATLDMLVHTHDAWTSVVPWGLVLSAATVVVLLLTGLTSRSMAYRPIGEATV